LILRSHGFANFFMFPALIVTDVDAPENGRIVDVEVVERPRA